MGHKNEFLYWLFVILWAIVPLYFESPVWVIFVSSYLIIARVIQEFTKMKTLLPRWLKNGLSVAALIVTLAYYQTLLGYGPSITLFIIFSSIKFAEASQTRDYRVLIYFIFFLLICNAIFYQNLYVTIHIIIAFFLLSARFLYYSQGGGVWLWKENVRQLFIYFFLFFPLIVIFFLFFPRFQGERMGLPGGGATTNNMVGFSDELNPGDFAQLQNNNQTSFRAIFAKEDKITPKDLYWRGTVLSETDGMRWRKTFEGPRNHIKNDQIAKGKMISYQIILEPNWGTPIFTLDYPMEVSSFSNPNVGAHIFPSGHFEANRRISVRLKYNGISTLEGNAADPTNRELKMYLLTPYTPKGKLQDILKKLYSSDWKMFVENTLNYFREQMTYTYAPGEFGPNPADFVRQLFFENKKGLCGHFASAFALVMRWGGIPSRVVVGYQGGEYNDYGNYWIVRQKNAHAWVEIYTPERKWERIDPTYIISPDRINTGGNLDVITLKKKMNQLSFLYDKFTLMLDTANYYWARFLLDFDTDYQKALFQKYFSGQFRWEKILAQLTGGTLLLFVFILLFNVWAVTKSEQTKEKKLIRYYGMLLKSLAKVGYPRPLSQGPQTYLQNLQINNPSAFAAVAPLFDQFISWRYRGITFSDVELQEWKKKVKKTHIESTI
ncbi:MAG: DUF3488 and transglutaminase-like domain-containing protein [Pseudomonadota bacterium]